MRSVCLSSQHTLVYCLPPDEMSSIDDSFLPDKFRIALPTSDIDNAKNDNGDMAILGIAIRQIRN